MTSPTKGFRQAVLFEEASEPEGPQFVCDVRHECRPGAGVEYHCMSRGDHGLVGCHLFGCACSGLHERGWPDDRLRAMGRCDLRPHPEDGWSLVPDHLADVEG